MEEGGRFRKWDGKKKADSSKTSQALVSEAEVGGIQFFLELFVRKIRIIMVHLIGKNNWGTKEIWEEGLSSVCTWGAEMIASSGQQQSVRNWKCGTRTHVSSQG